MDTYQINTEIEQANDYLKAAQIELSRPAEDVVPYMVCRSVREAITHYLRGFLIEHGAEFNEQDSLEELLQQCQAIDLLFDRFDLEPVTFEKDDEYSAEYEEMQCCVDLATDIRQLVA